MKDVLIITDVDFWVGGAGHRVRINEIIRFLTKSCTLTVAYIGHVETTVIVDLKKHFGISFCSLGIVQNDDIKEYGKRLSEKLHNCTFDIIIVEYIHNTIFLKYLDIKNATLVLDAHDIISERTIEFKNFNYTGSIYEMSEELEFKIMDVYDYIIVLCEPDFIKIASVFGKKKTLLCPHAVTKVHHHPCDEVRNLSFIASEYAPNIDAIESFLANCWPTIVSRHHVNLRIYGNICSKISVQGIQNVSCEGFVADIREIYAATDIIINPVRFGAGLKIKNIEALSHGIPLVTTSHGARGIDSGIGKAFLVANEPEDFVNCISALIGQKKLRIALRNNSHRLVEKRFSPEKCFAPIIKVVVNN
jgi:glycosyltransferase involved in cell wall biosynthesis